MTIAEAHMHRSSKELQSVPGWVHGRCDDCGEEYSRPVTDQDPAHLLRKWPKSEPRSRRLIYSRFETAVDQQEAQLVREFAEAAKLSEKRARELLKSLARLIPAFSFEE